MPKLTAAAAKMTNLKPSLISEILNNQAVQESGHINKYIHNNVKIRIEMKNGTKNNLVRICRFTNNKLSWNEN